jgi:hypothetical protein
MGCISAISAASCEDRGKRVCLWLGCMASGTRNFEPDARPNAEQRGHVTVPIPASLVRSSSSVSLALSRESEAPRV